MSENYFLKLFSTNVSDKIEKKNGLSYVSWAYAWAEVKKQFPDATYTVYENRDGWNYFTDGRTAWVKTGMTVCGVEHIEMLPVMDFKNRSIPLEQITSMDVNKTIQRSLTKAAARHGLGLYVYAGEDLPEDEADAKKAEEEQKKPKEPIKFGPRKEPKAQVETSGAVPGISEEMSYLQAELGKMAEENHSTMPAMKTLFEICRKAAIKAGKVPDKKITEYSMDEVRAAIDAMRAETK